MPNKTQGAQLSFNFRYGTNKCSSISMPQILHGTDVSYTIFIVYLTCKFNGSPVVLFLYVTTRSGHRVYGHQDWHRAQAPSPASLLLPPTTLPHGVFCPHSSVGTRVPTVVVRGHCSHPAQQASLKTLEPEVGFKHIPWLSVHLDGPARA